MCMAFALTKLERWGAGQRINKDELSKLADLLVPWGRSILKKNN